MMTLTEARYVLLNREWYSDDMVNRALDVIDFSRDTTVEFKEK